MHEGQLPEMNIMTYVQSITEIMNNMKPRTQSEGRRLSMAKQQLKEIKKMARKMQEQIQILEQKVTILEEIKEEIKNAKIDS